MEHSDRGGIGKCAVKVNQGKWDGRREGLKRGRGTLMSNIDVAKIYLFRGEEEAVGGTGLFFGEHAGAASLLYVRCGAVKGKLLQ